MSWLRCDTSNDDRVETLWCEACRKHEAAITGMKNFSKAWIAGSSNHKTSNVIDHATSEQHRAATARKQAWPGGKANNCSRLPLRNLNLFT